MDPLVLEMAQDLTCLKKQPQEKQNCGLLATMHAHMGLFVDVRVYVSIKWW